MRCVLHRTSFLCLGLLFPISVETLHYLWLNGHTHATVSHQPHLQESQCIRASLKQVHSFPYNSIYLFQVQTKGTFPHVPLGVPKEVSHQVKDFSSQWLIFSPSILTIMKVVILTGSCLSCLSLVQTHQTEIGRGSQYGREDKWRKPESLYATRYYLSLQEVAPATAKLTYCMLGWCSTQKGPRGWMNRCQR